MYLRTCEFPYDKGQARSAKCISSLLDENTGRMKATLCRKDVERNPPYNGYLPCFDCTCIKIQQFNSIVRSYLPYRKDIKTIKLQVILVNHPIHFVVCYSRSTILSSSMTQGIRLLPSRFGWYVGFKRRTGAANEADKTSPVNLTCMSGCLAEAEREADGATKATACWCRWAVFDLCIGSRNVSPFVLNHLRMRHK